MTIFILVIHHKHGASISAFYHQEDALDALAKYVAREWSREIDRDEALPTDEGQAIARYFQLMAGREYYDLNEAELA